MAENYLVLLRAVNVSGKNLIKMVELKAALENNGFQQVKTYIQSGNIVLSSDLGKAELTIKIQDLLKETFNMDIVVFVLNRQDLEDAFAYNPYPPVYLGNKLFFTFLKQPVSMDKLKELEKIAGEKEEYHYQQGVVYFYLPDGIGNSKLNNNFIEKKLGTSATGRNRNTMEKMQELLLANQ